MKNIFKLLTVAAASVLAFAACETYELPETEHTNVAWLDGKYICFGIDDTVAPPDTTVFEVEITNTADNDADAVWVTMTDYSLAHSWQAIYDAVLVYYGGNTAAANYYANAYVNYCYFLAAYRFKVHCDESALSFSETNAPGTEPETCYNSFMEQGYYSAAGYWEAYNDYKITVSNGVLTKKVPTATGYTTDSIAFDLAVADAADAPLFSYKVTGIRKTGWADDVAEYAAWVNRQ